MSQTPTTTDDTKALKTKTPTGESMPRVLRLSGHAAHARYLATVASRPAGYIPKQRDIPSPFAYSPCHTVYTDPTRGAVIVVETAQRRYDVFAVTCGIYRKANDAENVYIAARREED